MYIGQRGDVVQYKYRTNFETTVNPLVIIYHLYKDSLIQVTRSYIHRHERTDGRMDTIKQRLNKIHVKWI